MEDKDTRDARRIYNRYGRFFVEMEEKNPDRKKLSEILLSILGNVKGKKVLDAGCGAGRECEVLAKKGANVIGIDISEQMIKIAKERCKGLSVRFLLKDMEKTGLPSEYFDIILSVFSVMYKRNLRNVLKEFKRLLKKRGELLVVVPHPARKMVKYSKDYFKRGKFWEDHKVIKWFNYYRTIEDYINSLISEGFCIREIKETRPLHEIEEKIVYPHYLIIRSFKSNSPLK